MGTSDLVAFAGAIAAGDIEVIDLTHTLTPELDAEWDQTVAKSYPKVRGTAVPADIYDQVISELKTFRAANGGTKQ